MLNILLKVKSIFTKPSKEITIKSKNKIVYWTENGKSYHTNKDCISLLRSKNIQEGYIDNCPKNNHCTNCDIR